MLQTIDLDRLAEVAKRGLDSGAHRNFAAGMCAMEAASYISPSEMTDRVHAVARGQHLFDQLAFDRVLGHGRVVPEGDICPMCDGELDEGAWCPRCHEAVL